jgi:hypothetical protein
MTIIKSSICFLGAIMQHTATIYFSIGVYLEFYVAFLFIIIDP